MPHGNTHPLVGHSWFHGAITRDEAEYRIWATGPADGAWLLRSSQTLDQRLCLSIWSASFSRFFHIIIPINRNGGFYLDSPAMGFASMEDLLFFYAETRKAFTTQSGNSLRLLMSCERPSTGTCAPAPELDNYCSTMADAYEDGMPCKAVVFSAGNAGAAARPNSNSSSKGAVAGAVEKASQLAAEQIMIECSPESASIPSVTPSAPAKHPLSSDEDLNSASAVRERTVKRRAHRQLSSQRHNASDGKPILLRRRSEDSTFEGSAAAAAVRDRESVLRRLSHSVVHVLRLLLTLGHHSHSSGSSSGDAAAKDKSRSQTRGGHGRGHHGKRKSSKDKNRDVELTALPSGQRVINVNSANRPILFADEAADLIKIIQERRASAVAANAPPASSPAVPVKV